MRVLLALLLVGIVGCGGGEKPSGGGAVPPTPPKSSQAKGPSDTPQAKVDKPPAQAADADAVATLVKLGAYLERNPEKEVTCVILDECSIDDNSLVHLKGLPRLNSLSLTLTDITDAGLPHLKGMTKLQSLVLGATGISDAGLVHLKELT
ncbi:MAG TPA: hypothetical protein EYG03_10655, partial [Planctomycetes bacterium]|nr:hypothetical protein [Planctomycetota bacterium]